ncbi:DUF3060 domain-containing protein [Empedobacter sedimenti]|uniref:DUF3060 domain-containing protein n=1 Tax=Empedobacter sedimenti TaxID=3042610 RepID=UPI0024A6F43D|nr:DUF3060 domain-containing protein [Empedobacter sedimenti]
MKKIVASFVFLGLAQISFAQIEVDGNNKKQTIDCRGQNVEVGGNDNNVTLKGNCGKIELMGSNNIVTVNGLTYADLGGNNNKLYYSKALTKNGKLPQEIAGNANRIIKVK